MQYALLIYETEAALASGASDSDDEYQAAWRLFSKQLLESPAYLGGAPLKPTTTATTLRMEDGERRVQDGPYAESHEQLGGFILLELPSLRDAMDWAARCPAAANGAVEVRPIDTELHQSMGAPGVTRVG